MADDDFWNIETCSENWKALLCFYIKVIYAKEGK